VKFRASPPAAYFGRYIFSSEAKPEMLANLQRFLDDFIRGIERFGKKIESFVSLLVTGLVEFIEKVYRWLVDITIRIKNYLIRLFTAVRSLAVASFKLMLFYVPSVILLIVSYHFEWATGWIVGAGLWFVFITAVALTCGRRRSS
jgi:hypothetical protein